MAIVGTVMVLSSLEFCTFCTAAAQWIDGPSVFVGGRCGCWGQQNHGFATRLIYVTGQVKGARLTGSREIGVHLRPSAANQALRYPLHRSHCN